MVLKGHEFTRAISAIKSTQPLSAEGWFQHTPPFALTFSAAPSARPQESINTAGFSPRAVGATFISPALQRGETMNCRRVQSRRDGVPYQGMTFSHAAIHSHRFLKNQLRGEPRPQPHDLVNGRSTPRPTRPRPSPPHARMPMPVRNLPSSHSRRVTWPVSNRKEKRCQKAIFKLLTRRLNRHSSPRITAL